MMYILYLQHEELSEEDLSRAIVGVMKNRGTHYEENHPLFTDEFASSSVCAVQWAAFVRKNKIDKAPSFPEVMELICGWLQPIWESMVGSM